MKLVRFCLSLLVVSLVCTCAAQAQATRTWVSGVGDDANPCSRTAPCKTFAGAISKTAAGGEIDVLDPGGFGALTITKSITIDGGGGVVASALVSGTPGMTVNAAATDIVTLRNLDFQGLIKTGSGGTNGISLLSAGALHIEHCAIMGFNENGINITPNSQPSNGAQVFIEDTVSQDNGGDGLYVLGSSVNVHVNVSNSNFTGNGAAGINAADYSRVTIFHGNISGNTTGLLADAGGGSTVISIADSTVSNNAGNGAQAGGGGTSAIRLEHTALFSNGIGFAEGTNGTIASFGNNYNTNPGAPNATLTPQ